MVGSRDEKRIAAFGSTLVELRAARGLSQERLAHEAELDRSFVGRLEQVIRQPTLSVIFALARTLDVTPESLIKQARIKAEL